MRNIFLGMLTSLMFLDPLAGSAQSKGNDGFKPLFDGKSLNGWHILGGKAKFTIEDGAIVGEMQKGVANSFLATEKQYGDFILELDIKLEGTETNSGVQFRSQYNPKANDGKGLVYGTQVEIDPSPRAWSGGIYDEARRNWLYTTDLNEATKQAYKVEQYNKLRIEAIGDEVRVWINNTPTAILIDTLDRSGIIGLQVHSVADHLSGKKVYFKNIRIKTDKLAFTKLPHPVYVVNLKNNNLAPVERKEGVKLLFDGKNVNQWRSVNGPAFPAKGWQVADGEIRVLKSGGGESTNGGDIVTKKQYQAFDLSFDFKITEGANSGVKYFVTLKEETKGSAIGLEYQILDNEKHPDAKQGKDGNRTMASLYDLIKAEPHWRAARKPGEWNRGRIVVGRDNQVTHYLNGIKMLSYTRGSEAFRALVAGSKYKDWPNFGEALQGHILLQDHGDAVNFKNIKIKAL